MLANIVEYLILQWIIHSLTTRGRNLNARCCKKNQLKYVKIMLKNVEDLILISETIINVLRTKIRKKLWFQNLVSTMDVSNKSSENNSQKYQNVGFQIAKY